MSRATASRIERRIAAATIRLLPGGFRGEFGSQLARDLGDVLDDPDIAGPRPRIWRIRLWLLIDLARTVAVQWLRTGRPQIAVLAMLATGAMLSALDRTWRHARITMPSTHAEVELLLIATLLLAFLAMAIVVTQWATRQIRRPRRARR